MVVTPEMRQAVYDADCVDFGHRFEIRTMFFGEGYAMDLVGPNGRLPHVTCNRCGKVWLVSQDFGLNYDDAVAKTKALLKDPDQFKPKVQPVPKNRDPLLNKP